MERFRPRERITLGMVFCTGDFLTCDTCPMKKLGYDFCGMPVCREEFVHQPHFKRRASELLDQRVDRTDKFI